MTARKLCAASVTACIAAFIVLFPAAMLHSPVMALCAAAVALATAITSAVTFVSAVTHPCRVPAAASGPGKNQAIRRRAERFLDEHPDSEISVIDGKSTDAPAERSE